ncbi:MAG: hypothetical protein PWP31_626 [Clostridia bacterium]|nr:hypothetical protein [Clostridia bacterium]
MLRIKCQKSNKILKRKIILIFVLLIIIHSSLLLVGWKDTKVDIYVDGKVKQVEINKGLLGTYIQPGNKQIQLGDCFFSLPGSCFWPNIKYTLVKSIPIIEDFIRESAEDLMPKPSVEHILAKEGITLGPQDKVESNLGNSEPNQYIRVTRIKDSIELHQEPIKPTVVRRPVRYLKPGEEKVIQEGKSGIRYYKYRVRTENGVEVRREVLDTWIEIEPQPKIIAYGSSSYPNARARAGTVVEMIATAYTHTGNRTATGIWPYRGVVAVDPKVIPLGTKLYVEGYGYAVAQDTGGLIKGNRIDVFMDTRTEAINWGRRKVSVRIIGE